MISQSEYTLLEFWEDYLSVKQARKNFGLIPSFDEQVEKHFESIHGISERTTWRYGRFMLIMIYITTNKGFFDAAGLVVAGDENENWMLISKNLAGKVLRYVRENPITRVQEIPPPIYFYP